MGRPASRIVSTRGSVGTRPLTIRRKHPTASVLQKSIDLKLPEEENVLIILCEDYLKHVRVHILISTFVVLIVNFIRTHVLYRIQWYCTYRSSEVADGMVVILVVSETASRQLNPPADEVLLNTWLEFEHVPLHQYFL